VSVKDLEGLSPDEQLRVIADGFARVNDPAKRAALAVDLFGRSGVRMLPLLVEGAAGIDRLTKEAADFGLVMSTETAAAAEKFHDTLSRLWDVVKMGGVQVGAAFAPMLQRLAERFTESAVAAGKWIERNGELLLITAKVTAAMGVLGGGLYVLGSALKFLSSPLNLAVTGFAAMTIIVDRLSVHIAQLSDQMADLRSEGDKQRALDTTRMGRLEQLAQKEHLNAKEMVDAADIIDQLQGRYGDLGLAMNPLTGQITGLTEAQQKLNQAMRQSALAQLDAEIAEAQTNLSELREEMTTKMERGGHKWVPVLGVFSELIARGGQEGELKGLGDKMEAQLKRLQALRLRQQAITGGEAGALTGEPDKQAAIEADVEMTKQAAKLEEDWSRRLATLRLEQITDRAARERALIDEQYAYEEQRAREAGATQETVDKIRAARQLELAQQAQKQEADARKDAAEHAAQAVEKGAQFEELQIQLWQASQEAAAAKAGEPMDAARERIQRDAERWRMDLERRKEEWTAYVKGELTPELKAQIEAKYTLQQQVLDKQIEAADAARAMAGRKESVTGTFSGEAVWGLAAGSEAHQMVGLLDKIERNTSTTAKKRAAFG
jgi:hypothetical protein